MPSYTEEQRRKAIEAVEECGGGSVTRTIRKLGYSSRHTLYEWLNQRDALHDRKRGRQWSH